MRANTAKNDTLVMDRRSFLAGAAAAFMVPVTLTFSSRPAAAATTGVGAYIRIDDANNVTLITGQTEMGQGIASGLAQIMAEELMLDWGQVRFEHAPVNPQVYGLPGWGLQLTGGSTSTMMWYTPLRTASAKAAYRLRAAAALTHGGTPDQWSLVIGGKLKHTTYGEQTFASVLGQIGNTADPATVSFAGTNRIVGRPVRRLDLAGKVDGSAIFGADVMLPGMVFASVVHCLLPLIRYTSPSRLAVVFMLPTGSEPPPGSLSDIIPIDFPPSRFGTYFITCSSVPAVKMDVHRRHR